MRWRNDETLAKKVPEVDLFLGGHDHDYDIKLVYISDIIHIYLVIQFFDLQLYNIFLLKSQHNRWIIKSGAGNKPGWRR